MNWLQLAEQRKQELIQELQELIEIESVLDEKLATENAPFGPGPLAALNWLLEKGKSQGMQTKNIDYMAGHIEIGSGEEIVGILCHVDVVPAGELNSWHYPPFKGTLVDGKLFGRGAIDDKGPTIAAWLAMKLLHDAKYPLTKRVRLIIGTDEESGFRCVDRYFEKEEMPTIGFAPDADFPLINAEKGIAVLVFQQSIGNAKAEQLVSFKAGNRSNMVPDFAEATVENVSDAFKNKFQEYLDKNQYEGSLFQQGNQYIIAVKGLSAHAMEPEKGMNAAVLLAKFLKDELTTTASQQFVQFLAERIGDHYGSKVALRFADEVSGNTTVNAGIVSFNRASGGEIVVSLRYAVTFPFEEKITELQYAIQGSGFTVDIQSNSEPHYVDAKDPLVRTLERVYRSYTGDDVTPLLSTGGGTYARVLKKGVAFGCLFPGEQDVAHQANEFVIIDHLVKAAAIYAEAIVQLAGENKI